MEQKSKGFLPAGSLFSLPMAGSQGYPKMEDEDELVQPDQYKTKLQQRQSVEAIKVDLSLRTGYTEA